MSDSDKEVLPPPAFSDPFKLPTLDSKPLTVRQKAAQKAAQKSAAEKKAAADAAAPISTSNSTTSSSRGNTSPPSTKNLSDYLTEIVSSGEAETIILPRNSSLTPFQANEILEKFSQKCSLTINQVKIVIAILFQAGGTAKRCDGNLEATMFNKNIKLSSLRKTLTDCKAKGAERKLARLLANEIAEVALALHIPGNLSRKICSKNPSRNFSIEETVWLSDFQSENLDCPEESRSLINAEFASRKTQQTSSIESSSKKNNNKK